MSKEKATSQTTKKNSKNIVNKEVVNKTNNNITQSILDQIENNILEHNINNKQIHKLLGITYQTYHEFMKPDGKYFKSELYDLIINAREKYCLSAKIEVHNDLIDACKDRTIREEKENHYTDKDGNRKSYISWNTKAVPSNPNAIKLALIKYDNEMFKDKQFSIDKTGVNIDLVKRLLKIDSIPAHYELFEYNFDKYASYGGSGSSKTYSTVNAVLYRLFDNNKNNVIVIREYLSHIKGSIFTEFKNSINRNFISMLFDIDINQTTLTIKIKIDGTNWTTIQFKGLEDDKAIENIKGMVPEHGTYNICYFEELTQTTEKRYTELRTRLRATGKDTITHFCTFNPPSGIDWIKATIIDNIHGDNMYVSKTTYKDNTHLSPSYIKELMSLEFRDPQLYQRMVLGEFVEGDVFVFKSFNYYINDELDIKYQLNDNAEPINYGLDFGMVVSSTALVQMFYNDLLCHVVNRETKIVSIKEISEVVNKEDVIIMGVYYFKELYYGKIDSTEDVLRFLDDLNISKSLPIFCDNNPYTMANDLSKQGYNAIHSIKPQIVEGIDRIKMLKPVLIGANLIKEYKGYRWKLDKEDNVIEGKTVQVDDHLIDASRYCVINEVITTRLF